MKKSTYDRIRRRILRHNRRQDNCMGDFLAFNPAIRIIGPAALLLSPEDVMTLYCDLLNESDGDEFYRRDSGDEIAGRVRNVLGHGTDALDGATIRFLFKGGHADVGLGVIPSCITGSGFCCQAVMDDGHRYGGYILLNAPGAPECSYIDLDEDVDDESFHVAHLEITGVEPAGGAPPYLKSIASRLQLGTPEEETYSIRMNATMQRFLCDLVCTEADSTNGALAEMSRDDDRRPVLEAHLKWLQSVLNTLKI